MSGEQTKLAPLDTRHRRIIFRSWHRGMREMDLILGRFADSEIAKLSASDLDDYERTLEMPDNDVFCWITGEAIPPAAYDTPVLRKIRNFHNHAAAIHT